ncbi:MAG: hypothetical protein Q4G16_09250 [Cruoricaptor ignavus]|nr:hypothetical protein [Cruoricaptor ignavus]
MKKIFTILGLVAIFGFGHSQVAQVCETEPYQIANNNVALFHAGAAKGSDGIWYAWGENHGGATGVKEVNSTNYPNVPAGTTVEYVSGGSRGTNLNELVALLDNNTIVSLSDYTPSTTNQLVLQDKATIGLPTGVDSENVTSFYAGLNVIAIVADGKAYVHDRSSRLTLSQYSYGDGVRRVNNWGNAVRTQNGIIIEDFVSVRGASKNQTDNPATAFIGFTKSGKVYAWGNRIPTVNGAQTNTNFAIDITKIAEDDATAKPVLVGANYSTGAFDTTSVAATFYVLFDNGEFYSIGNGSRRQLGNFSTPNTNTWQRVRTSNNTNSYADVTYFSTGEHDGSVLNYAPVTMILRDKSLWAFGSNDGGILGIGVNEETGGFNPTISKFNPGPSINDDTIYVDLNGTTEAQTATSVEMGGHISFIIRNIGGSAKMSITGHGSRGSLLGIENSNFYNAYSTETNMPFTPCTLPTPENPVCYEPATQGTGIASNHGITLLQRAGTTNGNWPMARQSAHTVLESNTKGFVITRITTAELNNITSPQVGMMVYDTDAKCLKIHDGKTWKCFDTQGCYIDTNINTDWGN